MDGSFALPLATPVSTHMLGTMLGCNWFLVSSDADVNNNGGSCGNCAVTIQCTVHIMSIFPTQR